MIKNNIVYFTSKLIESFELSEIDYDLQEQFNFDYEKHDNIIAIQNGRGKTCTHPIEIDKMISTLQHLKSRGSTHVALDYHEDHIGYIFDGWEMKDATEEDVERHKEKVRKEEYEHIKKRKEQLERELESLKI